MFVPFPKIQQFRNAIREVTARAHWSGTDDLGEPIFDRSLSAPTLKYRGTVKLHGTNSGFVREADGTVTFQSRTRVLTKDNDNYGFARYMEDEVGTSALNAFVQDHVMHYEDEHVVVFGEWCGKGIQKKVAIAELDKMFVIFAIRVGNGENWRWVNMETNPPSMPEYRIFNIMDFPYYRLTIDFNNPQMSQNDMVELVKNVENECPVGAYFDVHGIGEGIVWTCWDDGWNTSKIWYKTKGEKHSVTKVKTIAAVDTEKMATVKEFVDSVVTENRLEQGLDFLRENNKPIDRCSTADYLRWVANDVLNEEADTMEDSGITKKDVGKPVSTKARKWFFDYIDNNLGILG
jgi:hypothetical protein